MGLTRCPSPRDPDVDGEGLEHGYMNLHEACKTESMSWPDCLPTERTQNAPADPTGREWTSCAGASPKPLNCVAIAWTMTEDHVAIARMLIEHGAVVDETVLRDHTLEMVGSSADSALRELLESARSKSPT